MSPCTNSVSEMACLGRRVQAIIYFVSSAINVAFPMWAHKLRPVLWHSEYLSTNESLPLLPPSPFVAPTTSNKYMTF